MRSFFFLSWFIYKKRILGDSSCCRSVVQLSHTKQTLTCSPSTNGPPLPSSTFLFRLPVCQLPRLYSVLPFLPGFPPMDPHLHSLYFFLLYYQILNVFEVHCHSQSATWHRLVFFFSSSIRWNEDLCLCNAGSFIAHKSSGVLWAPGVGLGGGLAGFRNSYDYWAGPTYCRTVKTKQGFNSWLLWDITLELGKLPAAFLEKSWHPNICINAACMFFVFFFVLTLSPLDVIYG